MKNIRSISLGYQTRVEMVAMTENFTERLALIRPSTTNTGSTTVQPNQSRLLGYRFVLTEAVQILHHHIGWGVR